jgi:hypothetical protein
MSGLWRVVFQPPQPSRWVVGRGPDNALEVATVPNPVTKQRSYAVFGYERDAATFADQLNGETGGGQ